MNTQIFNYDPQNVKQFQKWSFIQLLGGSLISLLLAGMMWVESGFDFVMLEIMGAVGIFPMIILIIAKLYAYNRFRKLSQSHVELTDHEVKYVAYQQSMQHIPYVEITMVRTIQAQNGEVRQIEVTSLTTSLVLNGFERMTELFLGIKANLPPNTHLDQQQDMVVNGSLMSIMGLMVIGLMAISMVILPSELIAMRSGIIVIIGFAQIFITRHYNKNKQSKRRLLFEVVYGLFLVGMGLFSVKYSFAELDRFKDSPCNFWNSYVNDSGCQSTWKGGSEVAFLPNGWLARIDSQELHLQDIRGWGWSQFSLAHDDYLRGFTLSTDGRLAVTWTFDKNKDKLWLWDIGQQKLLQQQTIPSRIESVTFVPHSSLIALVLRSDGPNWVELWEATTLQKVKNLPNITDPIAFSADGQLVAGVSIKKNIIEFVRLGDEVVIQAMPLLNSSLRISSLIIPSQSDFLIAQLGITHMQVWRLADGKIHNQWTENRFIAGVMAISPDSQYIAVGFETEGDWSTSRKYVKILRIADGQLVNTISMKQHERPTSLAFSPDGKLLAIGADFSVHGTSIFDVATLVQPK